MPKIAIAGKGGAGKTMITSILSYIFAERGDCVYAIDVDPNPTLGQALGFPQEILEKIQPILSLKELIRERTGAGPDSFGSYFSLNPRVDDLPEKISGTYRSIRLLIMGSTRGINTGCACTENTLVKALVNHLVLKSNETVLMDMVAGTEHIGRGTAAGVDTMIVVVEPSMRSIQAASSVVELIKKSHGINCKVVGNKIKNVEDETQISKAFPENQILCFIKWSEAILSAENEGCCVYDRVPEVVAQLRSVVPHLKSQKEVS